MLQSLTREQELLNTRKVELARVTCEKERRHREKEARMEKQRVMEVLLYTLYYALHPTVYCAG